jgi:hypothetical protein
VDPRWFKEDRAEAKRDKTDKIELIHESEKALKNSTLFQRRLDRILDELVEASNRDDEDFSKDGWEREHVANISRRKVLREIKKLIQL